MTPKTKSALLRAFALAFRDALEARVRNAGGDFSPDPRAERFPDWEDTTPTSAAKPSVSLKGLVDGWWMEMQKAGRTISTYESARRLLAGGVPWA